MVHLALPNPHARRCLAALLLPLLVGCQSAPKPDSLSLDSRLRLARTLDGPRGGDASVAVLREAVQARPQDGALHERLALAAERAGQDAEAAQAMREAIALQGPSLPRLLALGRLELRAGNPAAAAEAYAQARALAPNNANALAGLGLARDLAGDPAAAQQAYRAALALAPRDWTIRANLGFSLLLSGQARAAVEVLTEAEYAPDAPRRARHNLALALTATGQGERAVRLLRLEMGPAEATAMQQEFAAMVQRIDPGLAVSAPVPPVAQQVPAWMPAPEAGTTAAPRHAAGQKPGRARAAAAAGERSRRAEAPAVRVEQPSS